MKNFFTTILTLVILAGSGFILIQYWPYIFSKKITGVVADVQRVTPPAVLVGGSSATSREMFSFAVAIRSEDGEIMTASSEDRQWAVAKVGQCAEAKYFPYPPWNFEKAGTYFGARLTKLFVCDSGKMVTDAKNTEAQIDNAEAMPATNVEVSETGENTTESRQTNPDDH